MNYTGSVTKQYTAYDWYRTPEDNEARNTHKNAEPGSRPHNLKFTYNWMLPGLSRYMGDNVIAKARVRRLAVVGDLDLPERHLFELHLQLLRRGARTPRP